jgi:hypothetical protein
MSVMAVASQCYLLTWLPFVFLGADVQVHWIAAIVLVMSGSLIIMIAPAFALAVGVEGYFRRRMLAIGNSVPVQHAAP